MGGISIWHWIIDLCIVTILVIPFGRILRKADYRGALSLVAVIPIVDLIMGVRFLAVAH